MNNQKVISVFDYRNEASKVIGKKMSIPEISSSILNNEAQQNAKNETVMELDNEIAHKRIYFPRL